MLAVIHRRGAAPDAGALPIAGRPLIVRQLQWLRMAGVTRVAVEVGTTDAAMEVARWIDEEHALASTAVTVLAGEPLPPDEVARRAGFPAGDRVLALPADVIGAVDLGAVDDGGVLAVRGASEACVRLGLDPGTVTLAPPTGQLEARAVVDAHGWLVRVTTMKEALDLGASVLAGELPALADGLDAALVIHAAREAGDVWIGRGARVEEGATLVGPVLVGPGATVRAGATVGPSVVLGDRAVVERGATLREVHVDDGVVIGEGLLVERAHVTSRSLRPFDAPEAVVIDDPLLVAPRDAPRPRHLPSRAIAILALPLGLAIDLVVALAWALRRAGSSAEAPASLTSALVDVAAGRRPWIGTEEGVAAGERRRAPLLAVDDVLVPEDADPVARRLARAWYAMSKSTRLDARLAVRAIARLAARRGRRARRSMAPASSRSPRGAVTGVVA
jgi:hypothetical protein